MARNLDDLTIDVGELMSSIRVSVRMPRTFGLRMWVAAKLFAFAGWVSGASVVVDDDDQPGCATAGDGPPLTAAEI